MTEQNEPRNISQLRQHVRQVALACVTDGLLSLVAALREQNLTGRDIGELILDEWALTCHVMGNSAKSHLVALRERSGIRESLLLALVDENVDESVEADIEERRQVIRETKAVIQNAEIEEEEEEENDEELDEDEEED